MKMRFRTPVRKLSDQLSPPLYDYEDWEQWQRSMVPINWWKFITLYLLIGILVWNLVS